MSVARRHARVPCRRLWAGCLLGALVLGCVAWALPAQAAFPGKPGRIVFAAQGYGRDFFVFTLKDVDPRTKRRRQLTAPTCSLGESEAYWEDRAPDYSPDGRLIAYLHSDHCPGGEERQGLWVMRADGSEARRVAPIPAFRSGITSYGPPDVSVAFSPDGDRIVVAWIDYMSIDPDRVYVQEVFSLADGALLQRSFRRLGAVQGIDWSTSGRIAAGTGIRIHLLRPDGSGLRALTRPLGDSWPDWSPSGRTLVYVRDLTGDECEICFGGGVIMRASAGGGRAKLRLGNGYFFSPVLSPGGRRIAFSEDDALYVIGARRGRRHRLRRKPDSAIYELDWQPLPGATASGRS